MTLRVNNVEIAEAAVAREAQYHPAKDLDEARKAAAEALVIRELLLQRAAERGLLAPDDRTNIVPEREEEAIRELLAEEVTIPETDDEACRRYWRNNPAKFRSPDLVEAAHILLMAPPDDAEARIRAKAKAMEVIEALKRDPGAFAPLAAELSRCPSKDQGGRLGQLARGDTIAELETFLFNLDPGQLCPVPVETRYGYHVVRIDHRAEGQALPYERVQGQIAEMLRDHAWRQAVRQYIQLLIGQASIEGVDMQGAATPLVQ